MRTPDKNSADNQIITALFGEYVPKSKMDKLQRAAYWRVVGLLIKNEKSRRESLLNDLESEGMMSPRLKKIINSHFSRPYSARCRSRGN